MQVAIGLYRATEVAFRGWVVERKLPNGAWRECEGFGIGPKVKPERVKELLKNLALARSRMSAPVYARRVYA